MKSIPLSFLLLLCLTLGLAPFTPEPHVWEKLKMLTAGTLSNPVDIFDLAMHGLPFILLLLKLILLAREKGS
ncbi:MAG: RND transporter [Desulfobulbaceae bacterium S5133MH15]|nr:MAG: RND transporter [Desulfobulbaceae bacterium S5133MH15]